MKISEETYLRNKDSGRKYRENQDDRKIQWPFSDDQVFTSKNVANSPIAVLVSVSIVKAEG